jgi:hypothetical protein
MLANQIRHLGDMTPIMVIDAAVNGTAVANFLNEDQPARDFMALPAVLDTVGHDVTAVLHQWITSDMRASSYGALHEAIKEKGERHCYERGVALAPPVSCDLLRPHWRSWDTVQGERER